MSVVIPDINGSSLSRPQARKREHMLQSEKKHLKQYMKLENVERVKRIQEYKRLEVGIPCATMPTHDLYADYLTCVACASCCH